MEEERIIFQLKNLEKRIFRYFLQDQELTEKVKGMPTPTPTQLQIIGYLIKHRDEEVYQKELEKLFNLKRATVSGVLQTMEKNGLINRVVDHKDTRTKKILLNEKTRELFFIGKQRLDELEKVLFEGFSKEDLCVLQEALKQMQKNMEKFC